jgi:hypothetical protein
VHIVTEYKIKDKNKGILAVIFVFVLSIIVLVVVFLFGVFLQRGQHLTEIANYIRYTPSNYFNSLMSKTNLVSSANFLSINIDISADTYNKIKDDIKDALNLRRITKKQKIFYNAQLYYKGEKYDIKLRLKGDNIDHIDTPKISYRIKIKNGKKLFGMSEFSISHPKTRRYSNEWIYTETIRQEGILTPRNGFLQVAVNGKDNGIYIFEEHYTKEMIESQGYKESPIFFISSIFRDWQRTKFQLGDPKQALFGGNGGWNFDNVPDTIETRDVETFKSGQIINSPHLSSLREFGISRLMGFYGGKISAHEVFDAEKMGKALAIIELFAAHNTAHPDNFRFYLNPYTMLLEPVIREGNISIPIGLALSSTDLDIMPTMLADKKISSFFISSLETYTSTEFIKKLKNNFGSDYSNIINGLHVEFPFVEDIWGSLEFRASFLRRLLNPPKLVQSVAKYIDKESKILSIDVANVNAYPVELIGILLSDKLNNIIYPIEGGSKTLDSYQPYWPNSGRNYRPISFSNFVFELSDDQKRLIQQGEDVSIISRYSGSSNSLKRPLIILSKKRNLNPPDPPSIEEFMLKTSIFNISPNGDTLRSNPGNYLVDDHLIFPQGYNIELTAGTHISFPEKKGMFMSGAFKAIGTSERPITLGPSKKNWGGIAVMNAKKPSVISNARIFDTSGFVFNDWSLTGGVTFYKSDVAIVDTLISGSIAEDALNIVSANFKIVDSKLGTTISDGFDGDFVYGSIENSEFYDIGGDGVDFSGSVVNIKNSLINNVEDKGISAGESSFVTIDASKINNISIAVASKDGSKVDIHNIEITNAKKIAFAVYRKKEEYPFAEIYAINASINNAKMPVLVQKGSSAVINDELYSGEIVNVKKLYGTKVLGN